MAKEITLQSLERRRRTRSLALSNAEQDLRRAKNQYRMASEAFHEADRLLEAARVEQAIMESENVLWMKAAREKRIQEAANAKHA